MPSFYKWAYREMTDAEKNEHIWWYDVVVRRGSAEEVLEHVKRCQEKQRERDRLAGCTDP